MNIDPNRLADALTDAPIWLRHALVQSDRTSRRSSAELLASIVLTRLEDRLPADTAQDQLPL
ncbi:DUF6771 family protein [Sphingomonas sp. ID0503]|uniref:DUF6771 family protein n=1 Tax=Sphingomonas sp. ID0503 TaxID=3399691 RepID=UPI003AFA9895